MVRCFVNNATTASFQLAYLYLKSTSTPSAGHESHKTHRIHCRFLLARYLLGTRWGSADLCQPSRSLWRPCWTQTLCQQKSQIEMRDKMHDNIRVSERTSEYACQQICPIECWNIWITCQLECQNICRVESQAKCQISVSRMSVGGDHSKKVIPLVKPNILIHFDRDLMGFSGV